MPETLHEFFDSRGVRVQVDRQAAVIRGVKILGLESRNGRVYLPEALSDAARLYEEAKVNVNHPKGTPGEPRDYRDRIGVIRNVTVRAGEGLFADLHFNPKHDLAEQLVWDAEKAPQNVGFSHNVQARTSRRGERVVVEAITRVQSVDLVADPATTHGLFESAAAGQVLASDTVSRQQVLATLTLDRLRTDRPDLIEALSESQASELHTLRDENERLRFQEVLHRKQQLARRLLREHGLPDPDTADRREKGVVDKAFIESLCGAEDERAMRALIEQRVALVRLLTEDTAAELLPDWKPRSRDQYIERGTSDFDTEGFVAAIT